MGSTIKLVDGTNEMMLRPSRPYASDIVHCGEYNFGWPKSREVSQENTGQSGDDDQTRLHGPRFFNASLTFTGPGRHAHIELLKDFLASDSRPYLYVQLDGWNEERRALCRSEDTSIVVGRAGHSLIPVSLQLKIPSGVFESVDEFEFIVRPATGTPGKVYPLSYPKTYGTGAGGQATEIYVGGSLPTPPKFYIYGGQTNPIISDPDTGKRIVFKDYTIPLGSYVYIDVASGDVLLNGDPDNSVFEKIDWSLSDWWLFRKKTINRVTVTADAQDASAQTLIRFRDRFL